MDEVRKPKHPKLPAGAGRFCVEALSLTELSAREGVSHRRAQAGKDLFVAVVVPYGKPKPDGSRKERVRFLDYATSGILLAHHGIKQPPKPKRRKKRT